MAQPHSGASDPYEDRSTSPQKRLGQSFTSGRTAPLQVPKAAPPPAPRDGGSLRLESVQTTATQKAAAKGAEASPRPISPRSGPMVASTPIFKPASIPTRSIPRPPSPTPRVQSQDRQPAALRQVTDLRSATFGSATLTKPTGAKSSNMIGSLRGSADVNTGLRVQNEDLAGDRSQWKLRALKAHPEVKDLKERVTPIDRAAAFGRAYYSNTSEVTETVSPAIIMELIYQHLQYEGLTRSAKCLASESDTAHELDESRLLTLLRIAIQDVDRLHDLAIADKVPPNHMEKTQQELEGHLSALGVLDEEDLGAEADARVDLADQMIQDQKGGVKAASLSKLIDLMLSSGEGVFGKVILATYQSFTKAETLLAKLMQRYQMPAKPPPGPPAQPAAEYQKLVQLRVCNTIRQWINDYFYDFEENERLMQNVKDFCDNTLRQDTHSTMAATSILNLLNRKLKGGRAGLQPESLTNAPEPKVPKNIFSPNLSLLDVDEEEIARQLTLVSHEMLCAIRPIELQNLAWTKPKLHSRCANLRAVIHRFNDVSGWVAQSIVACTKLRDRVRVYSRFIKVMDHLRQLNNFNDLFAVKAAFSMTPIYRLKFTQGEVAASLAQKASDVEKLTNSTHSYKAYRDALTKMAGPHIPYLGVYLTDLVYVEEANQDMINGLINFAKRRQLYEVIFKLQRCQTQQYVLHPIPQISVLLRTLPTRFTDEELFALSTKCEPKGTADIAQLT